MKRFVSMFLVLTFLAAVGIATFAQTATPSVDNRERRQQKRIRRGVKSGSLTRHEAARLERQQARTRRLEAKAKSDGKVTRRERARLQHRENRTSRHVYRQKHDAQTRR
jgi:Flp pilus assembly protein TadB